MMKSTVKNFLLIALILLADHSVNAYTISGLNGFYRDGQVFLTWKNPGVNHLEYKVYRSTTAITNSGQLTTTNYLGFVRDSSAFNVRKTLLEGKNYFFNINSSQGTLNSSNGLYVAISAGSGKYFYAVTVLDLTTNIEDKTISAGGNSLQNSISESVADPQPVLQDSILDANQIIHEEYVMFGDNQTVSTYPAFNNAGSYGYNFTLFKKGDFQGKSLYITVRDDDPFSIDQINVCNDCNVLKMDDWLPNGNNTYWTGYNVGYDMYSNTNPVWTSGTVKFYTQARVRKTLQWVRKNVNVDSNKVYATGFSHNAFGAMLMGQLNTDQIAAVYAVVPPILVRAVDSTFRETQWCAEQLNLLSDYIDPRAGLPDSVYNVMDNRFMDRLHYNDFTTYMQGVNGKNDTTVGWVEFFGWYDSLNATRAGGIWFWDQRYHDGSNANFTTNETTPDYERFSLKKSYPAFSNCSINQNPGSGLDSTTGDPYGALNGYLDWSDASIEDSSCNYSITCFVKDFYVDGKLDKNQYDSCTTDLTIRRQQNFHPAPGDFITWTLKNNKQQIVQQGDFFYSGGAIILTGLKIYRDSSYISFADENCGVVTGIQPISKPTAFAIPMSGGYELLIHSPSSVYSQLIIYDEEGRLVRNESLNLQKGKNTFDVRSLPAGIYFARIVASNFNLVIPLVFISK